MSICSSLRAFHCACLLCRVVSVYASIGGHNHKVFADLGVTSWVSQVCTQEGVCLLIVTEFICASVCLECRIRDSEESDFPDFWGQGQGERQAGVRSWRVSTKLLPLSFPHSQT